MPLHAGDRIGPYEIIGLIGEGGMGQVYRASDTRLRRDVALKLLPEMLAGDADRLARFDREAQVLASLNHPNIAAIYGVEDNAGAPTLVLELVEGPTLADRIAAGPLPIGEALPIALQIAEALDTAHAAGIVHRDLKPANIKLRPDGTVKVLDFGLAKALLPDTAAAAGGASQSPTITSPAMTRAGMVLGTAAYVSPEQARGGAVDARSDVWAFGCVLFEMVTGRRAFEGHTITDTLAAVLRADPEWQRLPRDLHPRIRLLLERCLEKDVRLRYQGIGDARADIVHALAHPETTSSGATGVAAAPVRRRVWPWAVAAAAAAAIATAGGMWLLRRPPAAATARLTHVLPEGGGFGSTRHPVLTIAPDGTSIVFTRGRQLFLRRMDAFEATPIRGTEGAASTPVMSPDGRSVVYWDAADESLKRIDVAGGTPVILGRVVIVRGISWSADGTILYAAQDGIWSVPASGGQATKLVPISKGLVHGPQLLPGGRRLLYTRLLEEIGRSWEGAEIVVRDLASGSDTVVISGEDGRYVPTGHLLYALDTTLFAVPFDAAAARVTGAAVPVVEGMRREVWVAGNTSTAHYDVSANGVLAYVHGSAVREPVIRRDLVLVDMEGNTRPLTEERRDYWRPLFSPDGTGVAVEVFDGKARHLHVVRVDTGASTQVTYEGVNNAFPVWSTDGKSLIFNVIGGGPRRVVRQPLDGAAEVLPIDGEIVPTDLARDGTLVYSLGDQTAERAIWVLPPGARQPTEILATPAQEHHPAFSPDGKWLAYQSNASGESEIYIRPYPIVRGTERRVSEGGGQGPVWAPDGSAIYYRGPKSLMAAATALRPGFVPGRPRALFPIDRYRFSGNSPAYDIHPDGRRFVMVTLGDPPPPLRDQVNVVINWFDELTRRVPPR